MTEHCNCKAQQVPMLMVEAAKAHLGSEAPLVWKCLTCLLPIDVEKANLPEPFDDV